MTASSPGSSQSEGARSAERSAAMMVDISWRRTAAAPRLPPPAARMARLAVLRFSDNEMVEAWRSPAGPARSMSSPYVVAVKLSSPEPCWCHHSASPLPESGRSEEQTSELQSLMRNSYAVFFLQKKKTQK